MTERDWIYMHWLKFPTRLKGICWKEQYILKLLPDIFANFSFFFGNIFYFEQDVFYFKNTYGTMQQTKEVFPLHPERGVWYPSKTVPFIHRSSSKLSCPGISYSNSLKRRTLGCSEKVIKYFSPGVGSQTKCGLITRLKIIYGRKLLVVLLTIMGT